MPPAIPHGRGFLIECCLADGGFGCGPPRKGGYLIRQVLCLLALESV